MKSFTNHIEEIQSGGLAVFKRKIKSLLQIPVRTLGKVRKSFRVKKIANTVKRHANTVKRQIKEKNRVVLVYDNSCSPLTYGDYIHVIMAARFFLIHSLKVVFLIIDGEYREDFHDKSVFSRAQQFLSEQVDLANFISGNYRSDFQCKKISWEEAKNELMSLSNDNSTYIFREECVTRRLPIYHETFNVLNLLVSSLDKDLLRNFLLNMSEFANWWNNIDTFTTQPYLALNARYNPEWRLQSNTSPYLFVSIIKKLNANYPDVPIIVISDQLGCDYFKKVSEENNIHCLFSKYLELPKSFILDVLLVLGSKKYFQVNGGGLVFFAIFSSVAYEIICPTMNEVMWSKDKFASWQASNQVFKNIMYTLQDALMLDCL